MITCPRFHVEVLVFLTIMLIQVFCIPDKVRGNKGVVQQVKCPIPQRPNVYFKGFWFLLVFGCGIELRELSTKNVLELSR